MPKPNIEQCLAICKGCLQTLNEPKHYGEKNLFRSNLPMTDIRETQVRMMMSDGYKWKENDPEMLAEVLQITLRDMTPTLMQDVYEDILGLKKYLNIKMIL